MDPTTNRKQIQKNLTVANIINSVFLALLSLGEIAGIVVIKQGEQMLAALLDQVENADPESYMGGYEAIGGFFGAGAVAIITAMLYLMMAAGAIYLTVFVIENIFGYRIACRLKREAYSESLIKKVRHNAVFKCILALLVIIPSVCLTVGMQSVGMLVPLIPQVVVLVLAINMIRLLHGRQVRMDPEISAGEDR